MTPKLTLKQLALRHSVRAINPTRLPSSNCYVPASTWCYRCFRTLDLPPPAFLDARQTDNFMSSTLELLWVTNAVPFDIDTKSMQFKSLQVSSHGAAVGGVAVGGSKDQMTSNEMSRILSLRSARSIGYRGQYDEPGNHEAIGTADWRQSLPWQQRPIPGNAFDQ